jgi:hypothetical protein
MKHSVKYFRRPHVAKIADIFYNNIQLTLYFRRSSRIILDIPPQRPRLTKNDFTIRNTIDVAGGKPVAV